MVAGIVQPTIKTAVETEQVDIGTSSKIVSLPKCLYVIFYNPDDTYNAYLATSSGRFTIPPKSSVRLDYIHGDLILWADSDITLEVVKCRIL